MVTGAISRGRGSTELAPPERAPPELSANAIRVLEARYLRRDERRRLVETPEDLFRRVAGAVASAESLLKNAKEATAWEERFYEMLSSLEFLPNTPTLLNAGSPHEQLSACFVVPVPDTIEGIFEALKQSAVVQCTGAGTGFSFSRLRPCGAVVSSTGGEASGPIAFMRIFDCMTENIKQGGRRRGANMGVLRVDHPDVLEFIRAKRHGKNFRNFNLSVAVTDQFMEAVRKGESFELKHGGTSKGTCTIPARTIFNEIVESAWELGDPGLIFLDAINAANPTPHVGEIEATNPCGEVPLLPWESCNLGSINLARMIWRLDGAGVIDWAKLGRTVRDAIRFLDDVIEVNHYPSLQMRQISRGNRKIGLGVMGFAEALIRLGISYDSDEAVRFAEETMQFIQEEAQRASEELGRERGAFPYWRGSVYGVVEAHIRNATRTAIAPTGTIGILANTTAGIEPLFALAYRRANVLDGRTLVEVNPLFEQWAEERGVSSELMKWVEEHGTIREAPGIPEETRRLFATALEIPAERHLQIQAAFQRHVDNSVSKTINLPNEATPKDVHDAYMRAWELKLKGITIYRYGSKSSQVLNLGTGETAMAYDYAPRCDPEECRL